MRNICDSLDKPYIVRVVSKDEYIIVLAPSPLGALYNANIEALGKIPDEPLHVGSVLMSLGDFEVVNDYL